MCARNFKFHLGCNAAVISKNHELYLGRNLDVTFEDGFWVLNKRNIKKTAPGPKDVVIAVLLFDVVRPVWKGDEDVAVFSQKPL